MFQNTHLFLHMHIDSMHMYEPRNQLYRLVTHWVAINALPIYSA